jgi:dipeptidyl aminopeptidase/acylaminoacyl peptidase
MFSRLSASVALLVYLGLPTPGFGQGQRFTPQHVAKLRFVTTVAIAPDGARIAYVLSVPRDLPREKDGPAWSELHLVDTDGKSTPFITGPVTVDAIAWTPDGEAISFLAKRDKDEHRALYVISARGGEARRVLTHGADITGYSWAPDGKRVAFLATEPPPAARKQQQDQGFNQEIYEEDVRPVRVWIAHLGGAGPPRPLELTGSASELRWSPAGDKLAVALAPTPLVDAQLMFRKVHVVDLKTRQAINLKNPGKMGQLTWAPDGRRLAFVSGRDAHDPREGQVWVYQDGSKGWTRVESRPGPAGKASADKDHVETIAWVGPRRLACQVATGVFTSVRELNFTDPVAGGGQELIPAGDGPILGHVSAAPATGALAFTGSTPRHPPEVYFRGPHDKAPRRLTESNPWLKDMAFAPQEVMTYQARDGLRLEGVLVRPLGEEKGRRYPLVLTVHGGPEAHISHGWVTLYHALGQVGAARGFAVFYPNYRGSTGRGVEFSMLGQGQAAGKEFDDLVDGVDHLVKTGLVDKAKVGITGGSYGGYATAWGSTYYSDRFAAGVMFVGISDCVSKVGTTDIPWEMYLVHHGKWLWQDWDYFVKSSPIYHLDKAKTPLLILHGKVDPRVHPSQSLELYRHLKVRGKAPVRLVLYPGEGHGNRRAASRLDYNLRLLQWMEHYLKGPGGAPPPYELEYGLSGSSAKISAGG